MAKATPAVAGKLPTEFPFFTGMSLSEQRSTAQAVANEREALQRIGIGSDKIAAFQLLLPSDEVARLPEPTGQEAD